MRSMPDQAAELVTQLLFGEHYKVLESRKNWSRVKTVFDKCEGWIMNNQLTFIPEDEYLALESSSSPKYVTELISFVEDSNKMVTPILIGSSIPDTSSLPVTFDGKTVQGEQLNEKLIKTALLYLNSPELKGGKSPFGIDSAGFAQMVYKINGYHLLRTAESQSKQGTALSFCRRERSRRPSIF